MSALLVLSGAGTAAIEPFRVTDNHHRIEVYVTTPEDAESMRVEIECEHVFKSDARPVRFRQERFDFRDLHADQYGVVVIFKLKDGRETAITRQVFVSD